MDIVLIILGTITVDWLVGYLINYNKKKQQKRDEDLLIFKLEQTLSDKNTHIKERRESALELCRMTEGEFASGAYLALSTIKLPN